MERFLAKLERSFGRFAIENVTVYIVGGMAIAYVAMMARPEFASLLALDLHEVARGQVWRLVTYLFVPRTTSMIWILFDLYWLWMIGSGLEAEWGAFKLNLYYLLGMIGTTIAAVVTREPAGNFYLNLSLFFAFATIFPDFRILLFFILPVKVKWLAWISAVYVAFECVVGDWGVRAAIVAAFANYLLFFAGTITQVARGRRVQVRQAARRAASGPPAEIVELRKHQRECAICGAKEADGADIRVCSCDKCKAAGGTRTLCLEHARNH